MQTSSSFLTPRGISNLVAFFCLAAFISSAAAQEPESPQLEEGVLTAAEQCYERLYAEFLFDPTGAEWVKIHPYDRTSWEKWHVPRRGWLKETETGEQRIYFVDGDSMLVTEEIRYELDDFPALCVELLGPEPEEEVVLEGQHGDQSVRLTSRAVNNVFIGGAEAQPIYLAAWLWSLEEPELAAQMFAAAEPLSGGDWDGYIASLKQELGNTACLEMIRAFRLGDDVEALQHAQRLAACYPEQLKANSHATQLAEDLHRRQEAGELVSEQPAWPENFDQWSEEEKLDFLIEKLPQVAQNVNGYPGAAHWYEDRYVAELINLGEPAVPRLIEAVEHDQRLTRSTDGGLLDRTLLTVRELAAWLTFEILHLDQPSGIGTGLDCTTLGDNSSPSIAQSLRTYWDTWGHLPPGERWMAILSSNQTTPDDKRQAALALGGVRFYTAIEQAHLIGLPIDCSYLEAKRNSLPNAVELAEQFENPTAAEAILAAMDLNDEYQSPYIPPQRREIAFLAAVVAVEDPRICAELKRRYETAESPRMKRQLAFACWCLGDTGLWDALVAQVQSGELLLSEDGSDPALDPEAAWELQATLVDLVRVGDDSCEAALWSLVAQDHPFHDIIAAHLLEVRGFPGIGFPVSTQEGKWTVHPFCLGFLREMLNDESPTGTHYEISGSFMLTFDKQGSSNTYMPGWLAEDHRDEADERQCDLAAMRAGDLILGLPRYHVMLGDYETRLEQVKRELDRYGRDYVPLHPSESAALRLNPARSDVIIPDMSLLDSQPTRLMRLGMYRPNLGQLNHVATAEDFESGLALFHLEGRGELIDLELPAIAVIPSDVPGHEDETERGLIVQAERDSETGTITYGIIFREGPAALSAEEVSEVLLLTEPPDPAAPVRLGAPTAPIPPAERPSP